MSQRRLNMLSLLAIKSELVKEMDNDLVDEGGGKQEERRQFSKVGLPSVVYVKHISLHVVGWARFSRLAHEGWGEGHCIGSCPETPDLLICPWLRWILSPSL